MYLKPSSKKQCDLQEKREFAGSGRQGTVLLITGTHPKPAFLCALESSGKCTNNSQAWVISHIFLLGMGHSDKSESNFTSFCVQLCWGSIYWCPFFEIPGVLEVGRGALLDTHPFLMHPQFCFLKGGLWTSCISITRDLVQKIQSWAPP